MQDGIQTALIVFFANHRPGIRTSCSYLCVLGHIQNIKLSFGILLKVETVDNLK
jgi:hypothetical protein